MTEELQGTEESREPKGLAGHWEDAVTAMIPAAAVGAWTAIWPGVLAIAPNNQNHYLGIFGVGVAITFLYAFHELNEEGNEHSMKWFERYYQYSMAVIAFAIWAYYLASLTPEIPITIVPLSPGAAAIAMVVFAAVVAPLLTFVSAMIGVGRKVRSRRGRSPPTTPTSR